MSKTTKTDLINLNAQLVAENTNLKQRVQDLEAELLVLKSQQPATENKVSTIKSIPDVLAKLGWKGTATADFLSQFKLSVKNDNWCCIQPQKPNRETQAFVKEINALRFSKGIPGNWWNNTGCWMKFE